MASRAAQTLFKTHCYAHPSFQNKGTSILSELVSTLQSIDTAKKPFPTSLAILSAVRLHLTARRWLRQWL